MVGRDYQWTVRGREDLVSSEFWTEELIQPINATTIRYSLSITDYYYMSYKMVALLRYNGTDFFLAFDNDNWDE